MNSLLANSSDHNHHRTNDLILLANRKRKSELKGSNHTFPDEDKQSMDTDFHNERSHTNYHHQQQQHLQQNHHSNLSPLSHFNSLNAFIYNQHTNPHSNNNNSYNIPNTAHPYSNNNHNNSSTSILPFSSHHQRQISDPVKKLGQRYNSSPAVVQSNNYSNTSSTFPSIHHSNNHSKNTDVHCVSLSDDHNHKRVKSIPNTPEPLNRSDDPDMQDEDNHNNATNQMVNHNNHPLSPLSPYIKLNSIPEVQFNQPNLFNINVNNEYLNHFNAQNHSSSISNHYPVINNNLDKPAPKLHLPPIHLRGSTGSRNSASNNSTNSEEFQITSSPRAHAAAPPPSPNAIRSSININNIEFNSSTLLFMENLPPSQRHHSNSGNNELFE
jgi:hypothetical protein